MTKVYLLIGAVGAGKSTCAEKLNKEFGAKIISADEIYKTLPVKKISTKPYDHNIRNHILRIMCEELSMCIDNDTDCVLDYTNMPTKRRRKFLTIAKRGGAELHCKLLLADQSTLLNQLNRRESEDHASHKIENKESTTKLYLRRINNSKPTLLEGFNVIETYYNGNLVETNVKKANKRYVNRR